MIPPSPYPEQPAPSWQRASLVSLLTLSLAIAAGIVACGGGGGAGPEPVAPVAPVVPAPPPVVNPPAGLPVATVLPVQLSSPWALAFLPDGRMLVTEKAGQMRIVRADGSAIEATLSGLPEVASAGQGGLLDVALDPDFATTPWVYFSYVEAGAGGSGLVLARARLQGSALNDVQSLWRQTPKLNSTVHFGSRIVFRPDGTLYLALGDRGQDDPAAPGSALAQNPAFGAGKLLRLNRDGSVPADNPVWPGSTQPSAVWSLGHRNPQGAALQPGGSVLWLTEHGPRGGDELNRVAEGGRNYGWPLASYGCPYSFAQSADGCRPGGGTHAPRFVEPATVWNPVSVAPSGLAWYSGSGFAEWRGQLFAGALAAQTLWRITLDANTGAASVNEVAEVKALGKRIRDVRLGPDGWLYLLSDDGRVIRLSR